MDTKTLVVGAIVVYLLFFHKPSKVVVNKTTNIPAPKVPNPAAMPSTSQVLAGAAATAAGSAAKGLGSFLSSLGSDSSDSAADNDDMPSDDDSDDDSDD